jgi:crotonobetainyl-CoA:carnitine CoA-transferase CaiB-like acyl-CoA transferase
VADTDLAIRRDPPRVGQDTRAVLTELGYGPAAIEQLTEAGIVVADSEPDSDRKRLAG